MHGLECLFVNRSLMFKFRIEHFYRAERDVGGYHVKTSLFQIMAVYRFKAVYHGFCIILQGSQDKPCHQILFKCDLVRPLCCHRQETADACGWLKKRVHTQAVGGQSGLHLPGHGLDDEARRVKSRKHG